MFKKKQWTDLMLGVGGVKKIDGILVLTFFSFLKTIKKIFFLAVLCAAWFVES